MPDAEEKNDPPEAPVVAEIVEAEIVPVVAATHASLRQGSGFATDVNHLSAKGGAVGGLLLGLLALAGMPFSSHSLFNALLAILFSIWGLKSPLRKTAIAGLLITMAAIGVFLLKQAS